MMRRISIKLAFALILAVFALGRSLPAHAQSSPTLSGFALGALPNPVGMNFSTTITAVVFGNGQITPDGQVDFFISGDPTDCNYYESDIGPGTVGANGVASISYDATQSGTFPICGNYTSSQSGYAPATAGPFVLTVYAPTSILVYVPGASVPGATITFNVVLTTPSGQPEPTGTITLEDPLNGDTIVGGPANVSNIVVNGQGAVGATIQTSQLSGNEYLAVYSGDGTYSQESASGNIFIENPLTSISPASFTAGAAITSPYTACTTVTGAAGLQVTLTGIGFNTSTTAQILINQNYQALTINGSTTTQLTGCIPASALTSPTTLYVETYTGGNQGGPVAFQVYAPFAVNTLVSSNPSTFAYGSNLTSVLTGTATRTDSTDAAVPAGTVTFGLTGLAPVSPTETLGTAQLTQVSSPGTYQNLLQSPFDTNSTQKMISADLNGDGFVDVVGLPGTVYGTPAVSPYLQIFLSTGANSFQTEQQVYSGCAAQDFAVGDINGDSIPDLVVVCPGVSTPGFSNPLQAYYMLGNGDGSFQAPAVFGNGSYVSSPTQVVLGNFNNDGYNDIAVIDGTDGYLQIVSPFGSNTYDNYVYFDVYDYGTVFSAGAADFNQDGLTDIVLGEYSSYYDEGAVLPLMNAGSGNSFNALNPNTFSASTSFMWSMAVADVNGDGYPDIAIADPGITDSSDNGNVLIFENDESGNLPLTETFALSGVGAVAGAPFPLIGQPSNAAVAPGWNLVYTSQGNNGDIYVGQLQRQNATTWTQLNSTDTNTVPYYNYNIGVEPGFIVAGDLNGDGYLDFAATGFIYDDGAPSGVLDELLPYYYGNDAQVSLSNASFLPTPGTYSLSMNYPGNQLFQANNTATTQITISQGPVTATVNGPGSIAYGSSFTLNANIYGVNGGVTPGGAVTFYDGSTPLGAAVTLTPSEGYSFASLNVTQALAAGTHTINISYTGDQNYLAASNVANTQLIVNGQSISLSLTSSAPSGITTAGAMVQFQVAGVGATLPAGETVTLTGLPFAQSPIAVVNSSGVAIFSYGAFAQGVYTIQAVYNGDAVFAPAQSSNLTLTVNQTPVTVTLGSSGNPVTYPATVNLTANATSGGLGVPTGSIAFDDNGGLLSSVNTTIVNGSSGLLQGNTYANNGLARIVTVTGDFNHDGNVDIATLRSNANSIVTLTIELGNGDGTFGTPIGYNSTAGVDTTSDSMAASDLTGSGYSDLVIGASDGKVMVFLAKTDGSGTLQLSQTLSYANAVAVGIGDFTNNGLQDIAVASAGSVATFLNNGAGTFPTTPSWSANSPYMYSDFTGIAVADYNNDGYADIALSDDSGSSGPDVTVYLYSPGSSTFSAPVTYPVGLSATGIASGNLNNDAYPDLAVVSSEDNSVDVLINNQAGQFPAGTTYGVATIPTGIAIADFNGDSFADIAVTGDGTGAGSGTSILLSSATGVMSGETLLPTTGGTSIASGDFNNDHNPDLVVGSGAVTIFLDSGAQAIDSNLLLAAGTHPLTAVYTPSVGATFNTGTSVILSQVVNQDVPVVTWANPAPIDYGTPLSATQLDAVPPAAIPGILSYNPGIGTVLTAGTHQLAVTFTPTDAVDYQPVTEFATITVNQVASSITWTAPAAITYGTALSATQLDATASVPGTFAYDPVLGTVLTAGAHQLSVTFTPTDTVDYSSSTSSVSITVTKATPTVTWATPAGITYGTALTAAQLNATGSVPGVFTYTPAAGTVLTAGTQTLSVTLSPTDGTDYRAVTKTVSLVVSQATTSVTWATPAAISYGTALGAAQLDATASVPGAFVYNPVAGTVLTVGPHTLGVTFTPTDTTDYQASTGSTTIQVNQSTPTVTWANPAAISYGTALGTTQLNASASVPGTFAYNPATGTVLAAGSHTLGVTFTPTDTTDYANATANATIVVNQGSTSVTWATPAAITYGTALSTTQLNATSSVPGTFAYNPVAGTVLAAGAHALGVTFTPTDTTDYQVSTGSTTIQVNQATPTVTWANPAGITYGAALGAAQLNATASVPGTFAYSPGTGTVLTAGTHTLSVTFSPTDSIDYKAATKTVSVVIGQATSAVTWTTPAAINYGTALGAAQLDATASVPGAFVYNPVAGTVLTAGSHTLGVTFTPTDTTDYQASTGTTTIQVNKGTPTVSWTSPAAISYGTALGAAQLDATSSVPGTFAYSPVAGTVLAAGTHTLTATFTPTDSTDYASATANTSITVGQSTTTVTWAAPAAITYGTALSATQLNATASVPGTLAYNPAIGTVLTAGAHTLGVTFTPTDTTDYQASTGSVSITVNQATPTITWNAPSAIKYGTALSTTQLNATASVPGTFAYTPAVGTILTAGPHILSATFTPTDNVDYKVSTATVTITINQAGSTITWIAPAAINYGTALSTAQLDATASVPGAFAYSPAAGTLLTAGTHALAVTFTPTDAVDYKGSTASVNITVNQGTATITWNAPGAINYGTALSATQLNATASVPGTFTYNPAMGTVLAAGSHQLSVTFAPTDGTDYATTTANVTIQVNQATSTVTWTTPAAITYGTALGASQLDATATVPGTFAYNPAIGALLTAGTHTLGVTFTPTDTTDYQGSTSSVSIKVNQATPAIIWPTHQTITYGTQLGAGQLNATASTGGSFTYSPAAGTILTAGTHTLLATFTPSDATDYTTATATITIQVNQATPVITWPSPGTMSYGTPLSATQLDATATPAGGTFTYNPPAGTTLPIGTGTLGVTYVPTDTVNYATATATTTVNVTASLTLSSIAPTSAPYGSAATTLTLNGVGFTLNSVVELNGAAIPTTFVSPTQLTAIIPASFFEQLTSGSITVFDTARNLTSAPATFTVSLPNLQVTFSGPSTAAPGEQPTLNLVLSQAYPVAIQGTMTLTVDPLTSGGPVDPAVQFSTGGTTFNFTIPAGSTTTPAVQIQTGTLSATITVTLTLQANGQDIEPPSIVPIVVSVPKTAPVISSVTLTRSGNTLTVTIDGYSSPRDMSTATFTFTPAPGSSISDPVLNVDVSNEFTTWYSNDASVQFGSSFSYSQVFNLSNSASTIGSVSVVLTNSVGQSNEVTAQ